MRWGMEIAKIRVGDPHGLHLRQAALFVRLAQSYRSRVSLFYRNRCADGSSILDILSLAAARDAEIAVIAEGPDEQQVIDKATQLFSDGGGI